MANVPAGGVKKRLTLQTKKRYQICSPTSGNNLNSSGNNFTKCDNVARKRLLSLCIPKSSTIPPLPTSKNVRDGKAEGTCCSTLPTPNFELLTSRLLSPLDLKKCQPNPIVVTDDDTPNVTSTHRSAHVLSTGMCKVGGAVSRDIQRSSRPAESSNQHTSDFTVKKVEGVAATTHFGQVTLAQQKQVKVNSVTVISNHRPTTTLVKHDTNTQKTPVFDHRSSPLTKAGQAFKYSNEKQNPQGQTSRKRTWNEAVSDEDDEFDKLCNMVDLSFDADTISDQVTKATTPDNSWSNSQNVCHTTGTATRSTGRQIWTCPMCNEQFEGRSAEESERERHMIKCLAMDVT